MHLSEIAHGWLLPVTPALRGALGRWACRWAGIAEKLSAKPLGLISHCLVPKPRVGPLVDELFQSHKIRAHVGVVGKAMTKSLPESLVDVVILRPHQLLAICVDCRAVFAVNGFQFWSKEVWAKLAFLEAPACV